MLPACRLPSTASIVVLETADLPVVAPIIKASRAAISDNSGDDWNVAIVGPLVKDGAAALALLFPDHPDPAIVGPAIDRSESPARSR